MKLIIGSDFVPTESNFENFISGNMKGIIDENILSILESADYRIFNLETPLTDTEAPISKCGSNLIAPKDTVAGYKAISANLLTLSNNHIMDQGEQGLETTVKTLNENDIPYLGAGQNADDAAKPYVIETEGYKIGVYACAEHEFSIVTENSPGANPFDPLESPDHIAKLKENCDYVIVLYHGGKEHYRYPSPYLQKVCHKMADKGADLIVCQHSHCIGCEEKYNGSTIVYGQGNFLFDDSESVFWKTSLLISLELGEGVNISYIPICKSGAGIRLANKEESEEILGLFYKRSEQIKDKGFVKSEYEKFAADTHGDYMEGFFGSGLIFRIINKLSGHRLKIRLTEKKRMFFINRIECEAHRELLTTGLKLK